MAISTRSYAAGAVAVLAVLLGASWYATRSDGSDLFAQCAKGAVAGGAAAIGGPFTLTDENGATVTDQDVITGPTLVYFGYTSCPDVCPLDNARNAEATSLLEERGIQATPVFISVDPARDTPEVMRDFTDAMHPRMLGLSGTPEQIKAAAQAYKVYYHIGDTTDPYYLVDHTTYTYLMFPQRGFVEYFNRDTTPEQMADTVACYTAAVKRAG
ncbi:SCO family protein [Phaeovulum sp. W22_SRMD_FR3]|uniref:SCO family protein n=1 Tax=Phaeovulum sp. W22_SRMD_FR3 TaxID=3240274 RepID=UPI003F9CAB81